MKTNKLGLAPLTVIIVIAAAALLAVLSMQSSYYANVSMAQFSSCSENRICNNDSQCGRLTGSKCVFAVNAEMLDRNADSFGRCVCNNPTTTISPTIAIPQTVKLWWYDNNSLECQQKDFVGAYAYQGLMTFRSLYECEKSLFGFKPEIGKSQCTLRNGVIVDQQNNQTPSGYHFGYAIDQSTSCWMPRLNCQICNGSCVDNKSQNNCPTATASASISQDTGRSFACSDILGRCETSGLSIPVCPTLTPPRLGCRLVVKGVVPLGDGAMCPAYATICDNQPTISVNVTIVPKLTPPVSVSACTQVGGTEVNIQTPAGVQTWCIKGGRGCEQGLYSTGQCMLQ
jgi:hypothetical protein